jgi:hypothetical protein
MSDNSHFFRPLLAFAAPWALRLTLCESTIGERSAVNPLKLRVYSGPRSDTSNAEPERHF